MSIDIIKQQTKDLIDRLKSTTNNIGLGNSGNEYTVIVETYISFSMISLSMKQNGHCPNLPMQRTSTKHWSDCPMRSTRKCVI